MRRAVEVTDPSGEFGTGDLLRYVEDSDEPVTAHADIEEELAEIKGRVDPQDEDPPVMLAIAVATYLAFRRDEIGDDPGDILRLGDPRRVQRQPAGQRAGVAGGAGRGGLAAAEAPLEPEDVDRPGAVPDAS